MFDVSFSSNSKKVKLLMGVIPKSYITRSGKATRVNVLWGEGPKSSVSRDSISSVQNFLTIHRFLDTSFNKASPFSSGKSATFMNLTPLYLFLMASILLLLRNEADMVCARRDTVGARSSLE